MTRFKNNQDFVKASKKQWGDDAYGYGRCRYENLRDDIWLTCNKHGVEFPQRPSRHLNGMHGCPECKLDANEVRFAAERSQFKMFNCPTHGDYPVHKTHVSCGSNDRHLRCPDCVEHERLTEPRECKPTAEYQERLNDLAKQREGLSDYYRNRRRMGVETVEDVEQKIARALEENDRWMVYYEVLRSWARWYEMPENGGTVDGQTYTMQQLEPEVEKYYAALLVERQDK